MQADEKPVSSVTIRFKKAFTGSEGARAIDDLHTCLFRIGVNAGYCDVVEHTLLALVGIEAPASDQYRFLII